MNPEPDPEAKACPGPTPTSSEDPKYPLGLASNPNEDIPIPLWLCDPLGLRCKGGERAGVRVGLVVRLASRDIPPVRIGRSGNGRTFGRDDRAGDEPYRECMDEVGVCGREYDRARFENEEFELVGMTRGRVGYVEKG